WGARIRTWDRGTKTRCLTTWLRPTNDISLAVLFKTAAAAAKPPRPRRSAPQAGPRHLATPHKRHQARSSLQNGRRGGKATTASTVGAASGASALGYAPQTTSVSQFASKRRPRRQSPHGLDGRRRKRRLATWLRPTGS